MLPQLARRKTRLDGRIRGAFGCGTASQAGQCRLDKQQVTGKRHQVLVGHCFARRLDRMQFLAAALEAGAQVTTPDHAKGIADTLYRLRQTGQTRQLAAVAAHEKVQLVLHVTEILRQGITDRLEQLSIRPAEGTGRDTLLHLLREIVRQVRRLFHREYRRIPGRRAGNVIQHVLQQIDREVEHCRFFTLIHDLLEHAVELAEQRLRRRGGRLPVIQQCLGQRLTRVQQSPQTGGAGGAVEGIEHIADLHQRGGNVLPTNPVQQRLVIVAALMMNQLRKITVARTRPDGFCRDDGVELGCEQ